MSIRFFNMLVILMLTAVNAFHSAEAQTLDEYLKIADENNNRLRSGYYSYQASLERINGAGSLPDPELTAGIFIKPMERYMGDQTGEFTLMQMFPWFGTLSAAEDEAAAMANAELEQYNETRSMILFEVKNTWYSMYRLQKEISITEENLAILKTIEDVAISRLKSGGTLPVTPSGGNEMKEGTQRSGSGSSGGMNEMGSNTGSVSRPGRNTMNDPGMNSGMSNSSGSMADVLRIQIEMNELSNTIALLRSELHHLKNNFNQLLNRNYNEFINIPDTVLPIKINPAEFIDSIRLNNPMVRMLNKEEEMYSARERMNRKMGLPMIGLGVQYSIFKQREGLMMPAENMIMPMFSISLPIWRGKYNADIQETVLRRNAVAEQRNNISGTLMADYQNTLMDYHEAERRVDLYHRQAELTEQVLNIITAGYASSGNNFEELLRTQQQLLNYKINSLYAVIDQNIAAAVFERLLGR